MFRTQLIQPLCSQLGIDEKEKSKEDKSWEKVKVFFERKQKWLREVVQESTSGSPTDTLKSKDLRDSLAKLLSSKINSMKRQLRCESRQAQLDVRVRYSGGSAPLQNISNKQTVAVNGYLRSSDFDDLEKAGELFKWARTADEALKVRDMQKEFNAKVELVKFAALKKKENLKRKRFERSLKLHGKCLEHGGPITANNLEKLHKMDYKRLVMEVSFIKATVGKEIKMKKREQKDQL